MMRRDLLLVAAALLLAAALRPTAAQTACVATSGGCVPTPTYGCDPAAGGARCCFGVAKTGCPLCPAGAPAASSLFGCAGELWSRGASRLLDWSYAGYMYGDYAPPRPPWTANVKTLFGAKGDGVTDDTAAFELAVTTVLPEGVLLVPAGVYVITRRIDIDRRILIQGEGAGRSVLSFPRSLGEVYGNANTSGISQYAFGPGFINFNGGDFPDASTRLAGVLARAAKGQTIVAVDSVAGVSAGQMVRIVMDNNGGGLLAALSGDLPAYPPSPAYTDRRRVLRWTSAVRRVLPADAATGAPPRVELERPLPFPVDPAWRAELHAWMSATGGMRRNNTGLADLTLRFPAGAPYPGLYSERGHHGAYFYGTAHSWVRNVVVENAEIGIVFDSGSFNTVENVTFTSTRATSPGNPYTGSHGIWNKGTFDNLVNGFNFATNLKHELSVSYFAAGNVAANGVGVDVTIELMYAAASGNLFSNINLGNATEPFGWVLRGQDAAADNTFWNLRSAVGTLQLPPATWAPRATFVNAMNALAPANATLADWFVDPRPRLWPWDLWDAQRRLRGRPLAPPQPVRWRGPGYGCLANGTICCVGASNATCPLCPATFGTPSRLWGCGGELWSVRDRLVYDWGFAGFRQGQAPPTNTLPVADLKRDFGAAGDGVTDDSAALQRAIDAVASGVIFIPEGVYVLTAVFNIRKPLVLRGAGRGRTILRFPQSMTELFGNTWVEGSWAGTSQYSHATGFINIGGWDPTGRTFTKLTWVKANATRGDRVLRVGSADAIAVGSWVRLLMRDPGDGSLMAELLGGAGGAGAAGVAPAMRGYADPVRFLSRVVSKGADWVRLERAVPVTVSTAWQPELHKFMPMLDGNAGLEHFTVEFPPTPYPGHFKELGFNAIHLNQVVNGWVRGVSVVNGDMGVYCWGCAFTLVDDVVLASAPEPRGPLNGHRGMWFEHGSDNMIRNFNISTKFVHDLTLCGTEHGTVVTRGAGADLNLDHHRSSPYQNLFTQLDMGLGGRPFESSGDAGWGPHAGYYNAYHNLQGLLRFSLPYAPFGFNQTFVGLGSDDPRDVGGALGWYVEALARPFPANLYDDMRRTCNWRNPTG